MIKLTFLGDIMCKKEMVDAYKCKQSNNSYDFRNVFSKMQDCFSKSDMIFGNLETPVSYDNKDVTSEQYSFNAPFEFAQAVYDSGIHTVATANNHALDRDVAGIKSTVKALSKIGFFHTGVFSDKKEKIPLILNIGDISIGILSYTYGTNAFGNKCYLKHNQKYMVNLFQNQELNNPITRYCYHHRGEFLPRIYNKFFKMVTPYQWERPIWERREFAFTCARKLKRDIKLMKKQKPDLMVMYMHAGGQYNSQPLKRTKKLMDFLFNQGINIVVGSHEHVIHGGEYRNIKNNELGTYSLGNFVGIAGVCAEPFDMLSEYSVAWNVYVTKHNNKTRLEKTSFSVVKTIQSDFGMVEVVPVYDLIVKESAEDIRNQLKTDITKIASVFAGYPITEIKGEYEINCNN